MLDFLRQEGVSEELISRILAFRKDFPVSESEQIRIPSPKFRYYGREIWNLAITSILSGENILLLGTPNGDSNPKEGKGNKPFLCFAGVFLISRHTE